jgi:hypothetical protein
LNPFFDTPVLLFGKSFHGDCEGTQALLRKLTDVLLVIEEERLRSGVVQALDDVAIRALDIHLDHALIPNNDRHPLSIAVELKHLQELYLLVFAKDFQRYLFELLALVGEPKAMRGVNEGHLVGRLTLIDDARVIIVILNVVFVYDALMTDRNAFKKLHLEILLDLVVVPSVFMLR